MIIRPGLLIESVLFSNILPLYGFYYEVNGALFFQWITIYDFGHKAIANPANILEVSDIFCD